MYAYFFIVVCFIYFVHNDVIHRLHVSLFFRQLPVPLCTLSSIVIGDCEISTVDFIQIGLTRIFMQLVWMYFRNEGIFVLNTVELNSIAMYLISEIGNLLFSIRKKATSMQMCNKYVWNAWSVQLQWCVWNLADTYSSCTGRNGGIFAAVYILQGLI